LYSTGEVPSASVAAFQHSGSSRSVAALEQSEEVRYVASGLLLRNGTSHSHVGCDSTDDGRVKA
jgi:hypothetical protein